jgi:hypothetical protein
LLLKEFKQCDLSNDQSSNKYTFRCLKYNWKRPEFLLICHDSHVSSACLTIMRGVFVHHLCPIDHRVNNVRFWMPASLSSLIRSPTQFIDLVSNPIQYYLLNSQNTKTTNISINRDYKNNFWVKSNAMLGQYMQK